MSDGVAAPIADEPINVEPNMYYKLSCRFNPNFISVFLNGVLQLEVDSSSVPSTVSGTAGLFTKAGKADFRSFVCASSFFEQLAPEGAFETINTVRNQWHRNSKLRFRKHSFFQMSPIITRKVTNEEELRMIRSKQTQFRQLDIHDNQSVDSTINSLARAFTIPKDYVDPEIKGKEDYLPDSTIHVPDEGPFPEGLLCLKKFERNNVLEKIKNFVLVQRHRICIEMINSIKKLGKVLQ